MNASSQAKKKIVTAWVCLFAALASYVPLVGAAWAVHAMSCCTEEYCPIAQHHHQKRHSVPHSDMDCGHDMGEMMDCSMSCGENSEKPLVTAVAFVLPDLTFTAGPISVTGTADTLKSFEVPRSLKPLSPPPRFAPAS